TRARRLPSGLKARPSNRARSCEQKTGGCSPLTSQTPTSPAFAHSPPADTTALPSCAKATDEAFQLRPFRTVLRSRAATSHNSTAPAPSPSCAGLPTTASALPSGAKATPLQPDSAVRSVACSLPVAASHNLTDLSQLAV